MRQLVVHNIYTPERFESILEVADRIKPDFIVCNGNLLGLHLAKPDKNKTLLSICPELYEGLKDLSSRFHSGKYVEEEIFGPIIYAYMRGRYDFILSSVKKLSRIAPVYFISGVNESPFHYKVIDELAYLLNVAKDFLKQTALLSNFRNIYDGFLEKFKYIESRKINYLGNRAILLKDFLLVGITALHNTSLPVDSLTEIQENLTEDVLNTAKRKFSYAKKLLIYTPLPPKNSKPFHPGSPSLRRLLEESALQKNIVVQPFSIPSIIYRGNFVIVLSSLCSELVLSHKTKFYSIDPCSGERKEII